MAPMKTNRREGAGHAAGGEHIVAGVPDPRGCLSDGVEDLLHAVGDAGGLRRRCRAGVCGAGQVEQVGASEVAAFHADVVVDAHADQY